MERIGTVWRCVVSGRYRVQVRVVWVAKISESKNHHVCEQTAAMIGGDRYINMRRKKHKKYLKLMRCERGGVALKKKGQTTQCNQASKKWNRKWKKKKKTERCGSVRYLSRSGKQKNNFFTWRLEWDFSFIIIKGGEGEFFFTEKGRVGRGMMRFTAT